LERGSNDSEIMDILGMNPNTYQSYTDPNFYDQRMEGLRDYCARNNLQVNPDNFGYIGSYKELKRLAYLKRIDDTIQSINSGGSTYPYCSRTEIDPPQEGSTLFHIGYINRSA
jgi:hypothetical protein